VHRATIDAITIVVANEVSTLRYRMYKAGREGQTAESLALPDLSRIGRRHPGNIFK